MAKKNRDIVEEDSGRFQIGAAGRSITKAKLVTVTVSFNEEDNTHIVNLAETAGLARAEFVRRCIVHCLRDLGKPLPSMSNQRRTAVVANDEE